jgi:hypothetical protein
LVTALLGIAGYVMQNKASIAANSTQHDIVQEAAERQRVEDKAGKQLERVQAQMELLINPLLSACVSRAAITFLHHMHDKLDPLD